MLDTVKDRQATRPPVHAHDLEDEVLKDDSGEDVRLGDLWRDRPTALVFLRHFGCVFCRHHAVRLHRARQGFEDAGVGLAVIGMGTPEDAADFRRIHGMELPVLVDPDRRIYERAGAKIATIDELAQLGDGRLELGELLLGGHGHRPSGLLDRGARGRAPQRVGIVLGPLLYCTRGVLGGREQVLDLLSQCLRQNYRRVDGLLLAVCRCFRLTVHILLTIEGYPA